MRKLTSFSNRTSIFERYHYECNEQDVAGTTFTASTRQFIAYVYSHKNKTRISRNELRRERRKRGPYDDAIHTRITFMEDINAFNEYRRITLPYQRGGNDLMQSTQMGGQQSFAQQQVPPTRKPPVPAKMPKAKALALLRKLKRGIVVASFLSFGTFGALAVSHTVGTTASQTSSTSTTTTQKSTSTSTSTPSATSTSTSTPTPASTSSSTQQGGSYGFGSSSSTSNPVSSTHTS